MYFTQSGPAPWNPNPGLSAVWKVRIFTVPWNAFHPVSSPATLSAPCNLNPGLEVIKLEFILRLKIKRNDWLLADTCPQAANHCALF